MNLRLVTAPSVNPLTLADVERQIRQTDLSAESEAIELMISAITEQAEAVTRRAFITQTWELLLDAFPSNNAAIYLPKPPLQSVVSITYVDNDEVEQTLDASHYRVVTEAEPGYVKPAFGAVWPVALRDSDVVKVRFICGYGPVAPETSDNVPKAIKQWCLINIANLYENRETVGVALNRFAMFDFTTTICDGLIETYRIHRV